MILNKYEKNIPHNSTNSLRFYTNAKRIYIFTHYQWKYANANIKSLSKNNDGTELIQ